MSPEGSIPPNLLERYERSLPFDKRLELARLMQHYKINLELGLFLLLYRQLKADHSSPEDAALWHRLQAVLAGETDHA